MIEFGRPQFLPLVWLAPVMLIIAWWTYRKYLLRLTRFLGAHLFSEMFGKPSVKVAIAKILLLASAIGFIALSLARPRHGFEWRETPQSGLNLMIAMDLSQSMLSSDVAPSRLVAAKRKVIDLLSMLKADRVGLVGFAGIAFVQCPLTADFRALQLFLDNLDTNLLPIPGTAISVASNLALDSLQKASAEGSRRAVLLITDGEDHGKETQELITKAKNLRIPIHVLAVGTAAGAPVPTPDGQGFKLDRSGQTVISRLNEGFLQNLADSTGGIYSKITAGDQDLMLIYGQGLGKQGEGQNDGTSKQKVWREKFQWPLAAAFLMLLLELVLQPRWIMNPKGYKMFAHLLILLLYFQGSTVIAQALSAAGKAFENNDYEHAAALYDQAAKEKPSDGRILYNKGVSEYLSGKFDEALTSFEAASKVASNNELRGRSLYNMGNTKYAKGDLSGAKAAFENALQQLPKDRSIAENLEFVAKKLKDKPPEQQSQKGNQNPSENKDSGEDKPHQEDQTSGSTGKSQETNPDQRGSESKGEQKESRNENSDRNSSDPSKADGAKASQNMGQQEPIKKEKAGLAEQDQKSGGVGQNQDNQGQKPEAGQTARVQVQEGQMDPKQADQLIRSLNDKTHGLRYVPKQWLSGQRQQTEEDW